MEANLLSEDEIARFARGAILWVLLPCLLLWALQQSADGNPSPEYWQWPFPQRYLAFALQAFVWLALAYWVFAKGGADTLSAYFSVGNKLPAAFHSPAAVKIGTVAAIASGVVALLGTHA